jgi:cobalamin biosynthesis protein CbiD
MFKAEPHSDPKPEISGTGTFTQDGQVEPTGANAVEQEPAQEVPNEVEPVSAEQPDIQ